MNPFQHGEVFVTDDGAETDLDLGHYERFMDMNLTQLSNFTTGSVYQSVINEERNGNYLGSTIQIIPHITDEIKRRIWLLARQTRPDVEIVEIGGTVGDIESQPFIETIRQFRIEVGRANSIFIHVVKIDYIYPSDEAKTKPIQQSVALLRGLGIQPDFLIVRCKKQIEKSLITKIALFCSVKPERIIPAPNTEYIYDIPYNLEKAGLTREVLKFFELKPRRNTACQPIFIKNKTNKSIYLKIALVGKYLDHPDAYISVVEAIKHALDQAKVEGEIVAVDSDESGIENKLKETDAIIVPGGFGIRGIEGKIKAVRAARENKIPFLGLCLGLQVAVIEFARNICKLNNANSTEFAPKTKYPVIEFLPEQRRIEQKGGTMRLGKYPARLSGLVKKLYGRTIISERHRHRYEVNPKYHQILIKNGLIFSGLSPNRRLVEFIELPQQIHPYFVATQAHPEFKSRPNRAHPLFAGLIATALTRKEAK